MLFIDGAYTFEDEPPRFHRVRAPTHAELQRLLHAIATRITRALERQGLLLRADPSCVLDIESADDFDSLFAAAVHYRIATGPHAGCKALSLHTNTPTATQIGRLFHLSFERGRSSNFVVALRSAPSACARRG